VKELRKMLVRQVVDCQDSPGFYEWRQHVLSVENIRLGLGEQARQNGTNPDDGVLGNRGKVKSRTANPFLAKRDRMSIEKVILIMTRGLRKPAKKLAAICFIASGLSA